MVQNVNPTFVKTPNIGVTAISTGAGIASTPVTIYTGGASGSKIVALYAVAAGTTAAFDVSVLVSNGVSAFTQTTVSVATNAGFVSATPTANLLSTASLVGTPYDSDGNVFMLLPSSSFALQVQLRAFSSLWTAGAQMQFTAIGGDF